MRQRRRNSTHHLPPLKVRGGAYIKFYTESRTGIITKNSRDGINWRVSFRQDGSEGALRLLIERLPITVYGESHFIKSVSELMLPSTETECFFCVCSDWDA